jgi:hypothetical protein
MGTFCRICEARNSEVFWWGGMRSGLGVADEGDAVEKGKVASSARLVYVLSPVAAACASSRDSV